MSALNENLRVLFGSGRVRLRVYNPPIQNPSSKLRSLPLPPPPPPPPSYRLSVIAPELALVVARLRCPLQKALSFANTMASTMFVSDCTLPESARLIPLHHLRRPAFSLHLRSPSGRRRPQSSLTLGSIFCCISRFYARRDDRCISLIVLYSVERVFFFWSLCMAIHTKLLIKKLVIVGWSD